MKFTRKANANWKGTGMEGKGTISTQSTTLDNAQLSFKTRFADGVGTNPEELVAAAHSGCFTMQLSFYLTKAVTLQMIYLQKLQLLLKMALSL